MALTKVSTDGVKDDAITKSKIPANQIEASELADNAVDTNAIANDAITTDKLANSIVNDINANSAKVQTTINSNANNKVITGSDTANTLESESNLTFDGSKLQVNNSSLSQIVQSYANNNRFKTLVGSNFLQMITQNNVSLQFRYATDTGSGSEIMRLNANGLSFDGTNNAASSLDDYEEGQWTPNIQGTGSNNSKTYVNQMGEYTKIGHMVFVRSRVSWSARNTDSGSAAIFGLPYACTDNIGIGGAMAYSTITFGGTSSSKPRDHVLETINNDTGLLIITSEDGETFGNVAASIVWTSSGEVRGTAFYTTG